MSNEAAIAPDPSRKRVLISDCADSREPCHRASDTNGDDLYSSAELELEGMKLHSLTEEQWRRTSLLY